MWGADMTLAQIIPLVLGGAVTLFVGLVKGHRSMAILFGIVVPMVAVAMRTAVDALIIPLVVAEPDIPWFLGLIGWAIYIIVPAAASLVILRLPQVTWFGMKSSHKVVVEVKSAITGEDLGPEEVYGVLSTEKRSLKLAGSFGVKEVLYLRIVEARADGEVAIVAWQSVADGGSTRVWRIRPQRWAEPREVRVKEARILIRQIEKAIARFAPGRKPLAGAGN